MVTMTRLLTISGTSTDANSAPSLLTKEISDFTPNDVLLVSVVFGAILLSILIGFGIKTYLHLRHSQKSSTDEDTPAVRADLPVKIERPTATREAPPMPVGLRNSEPAMSKSENGS